MLKSFTNSDQITLGPKTTFACIYIFGSTVGLAATSYLNYGLIWQWAVAMIGGLAYLAFVILAPKITVKLNTALFLATTIIILFASWVTTQHAAENNDLFAPTTFVGFKIVALSVALIVPRPVWSGYLILALTTLLPILQVYIASPEIRAGFTMNEPWINTAYMIAAFFIFKYRVQSMERQKLMYKMDMEQKRRQELAGIFLALRDLTNSPIHSIDLTASLLESNDIDRVQAAKILKNSVDRLRELSKILRGFESQIDWSQTDTSFDPIATLYKGLNDYGPPVFTDTQQDNRSNM